MNKKSDDFKARALELLGTGHRGITAKDRHALWDIAFAVRPITAADAYTINRIAERIKHEAVT